MSAVSSVPWGCSTESNLPHKKNKSVDIFNAKYKKNCNLMHTQPLRGLKLHALNSSLDIIGDRIKYEDWLPLLKTISADRNLHFLALRSRHSPGTVILEHVSTEKQARDFSKGSVLFTKYMLIKVVEAFAACITHSKTLMCLQFQSIPLQSEAMNILAQALSKTNCLQHLVLHYCNIGDEGCKFISKALRNQPTVQTIDLSNCQITEQGAYYIAELIKVQEIARFGECWKHSLRYREVSHEIISGLRRIILNNNPNIGDKGLQSIVLVLCDDFWIRALDMQNCGITDLGCTAIINLISMNNKIVVFDIRRNPIQDQNKITEIFHLLFSHSTPSERSEYGWLKIEPSSSSSSSNVSSISTYSYRSRPHKLPSQVKSAKNFGVIKKIARSNSENMNLGTSKSSPGRISTASINSEATWKQFSREKITYEKTANAPECAYYTRYLDIEKLKC